MKALNFGARERLGECVSNHVATLAVDEAKQFVVYHLLAELVVSGIEVLHTGSGCGRISHLDARCVVLEHRGGADLGDAQIGEEDADTECIAARVEGGEVLSVRGAGGDSGLAPANVVDACASEERTVAGGGSTVVEASAVVGEEVAVDVVVERFASALELDSSVGCSGDPAENVR